MSREEGLRQQVEVLKQKMKEVKEMMMQTQEREHKREEHKKMMRKIQEGEGDEERTRSGTQGLTAKGMDSQMHEEPQSRMREIENKTLGSAETARITAAGTAERQETLNAQGVINEHGTNLYLNSGRSDFSYQTPSQRWSSHTINSNNSYVHFPFCNGHRRDDMNFPRGNVGQQQLWAQGGIGQHQQQMHNFSGRDVGQQRLWARGGIGQQQQQMHSWNRHRPKFAVYKQRSRPPLRQQHRQQKLPRRQRRSSYHRTQRFRPPSQHPHQRGGPKYGPGGPWDCGHNASYPQEESPVPANAPMGAVHQCTRCGRHGHLASICGAPRRLKGNCAACGEYGHPLRSFAMTRRPIPIHPHASVTNLFGDCCGEVNAIRRALPRKARSRRPLQRVFTNPSEPYPPPRAFFVGEMPQWGGEAVVDTTGMALAPAVSTVTGSGVFPAASARRAENAPASAAQPPHSMGAGGGAGVVEHQRARPQQQQQRPPHSMGAEGVAGAVEHQRARPQQQQQRPPHSTGAEGGAGAVEHQRARPQQQQQQPPLHSMGDDGTAVAISAVERGIPAAERHSIPGGGSATAVAAAAAAVPPDRAREMAAARGDVFPTSPPDWKTTRYIPLETATPQRWRDQMTLAAMRSLATEDYPDGSLSKVFGSPEPMEEDYPGGPLSEVFGPESDGLL